MTDLDVPLPEVLLPGVLGGASLTATDYASFLGREYLAEYLPAGGAAVKIAVAGSAGVADRFERALGAEAGRADCLYVTLSAETVKLSQVEQVYFAVARAVDWDAVAAAVVRTAYDDAAFPSTGGLTVAEVAAEHEVDSRELYRSVRRQLEHSLLGDTGLARELRRAMLRLAQVQLGGGDVDRTEHDAVLGWLRGEPGPIAALRPALIASRIGRGNARALLLSTSRLLLRAGRGGLVLHLDATRLAEARRPPVEERTGTYYSKAAVLDAYEVLRQLIDATDELRGVLVVVVLPPELVNDDARGLPAYTALHLRVADEVRDRRRPNPFAALVRLEVRMEAVRGDA